MWRHRRWIDMNKCERLWKFKVRKCEQNGPHRWSKTTPLPPLFTPTMPQTLGGGEGYLHKGTVNPSRLLRKLSAGTYFSASKTQKKTKWGRSIFSSIDWCRAFKSHVKFDNIDCRVTEHDIWKYIRLGFESGPFKIGPVWKGAILSTSVLMTTEDPEIYGSAINSPNIKAT